MATKLAELYVNVGLDASNMLKGLDVVDDAMAGFDDTSRRLKGSLDVLGEGVGKSAGRFQDFGRTIKDAGSELKSVGQSMSLYVTAPIVGAAGVATKAAIDFQSAFAGVRKTVNATEPEFKALEAGIRQMAKEIPASAVEIARVAEAAGQLGIQKSAIMGFTRTMVDLGVATNLSADEAATQLARFANITQMSQDKFSNLGSAVVALGNNLATTEAEIVAMGVRLAGAGKLAGLSEAQIMGFAGALSSVGVEAEAGGTAFSKVFKDINSAVLSGGKELTNFAMVAGMSAAEFKRAFQADAAGALTTFIGGLGKIKAAGGDVQKILAGLDFSDSRLQDALIRAAGAGDLFAKSIKLASAAFIENSALAKEAAQRYATWESQIKIAKNQITDAAITLGNVLAPVLVTITKGIADAVSWFDRLSQPVKTATLIIAGFAAALGPMLIVAGAVTSAVGALATAMGGMAAVGTLALTIGGVVVALTALGTALTVAYQESEAFRTFVHAAFEGTLAVVRDMLGRIEETISAFVGLALTIWREWGDTIMAVASDVASGVWSFIKGGLDQVLTITEAGLSVLADVFRGATALIQGDISGAVSAIIRIWMTGVETIVAIIENAGRMWLGIFGSIGKGIIDLAGGIIRGVWKWMTEGLVNIGTAINAELGNWLRGWVDWANKGLKVVGDFVRGIGTWFRDNLPVVLKPMELVINKIAEGWAWLKSKVTGSSGDVPKFTLDIGKAFASMKDVVVGSMDKVTSGVKTNVGQINPALASIGKTAEKAGKKVAEAFDLKAFNANTMRQAMAAVDDVFAKSAKEAEAWKKHREKVLAEGVKEGKDLVADMVKSWAEEGKAARKAAKDVADELERQMKAASASVNASMDIVKGAFSGAAESAKGFGEEAYEVAQQAERSMDRILDGVKNMSTGIVTLMTTGNPFGVIAAAIQIAVPIIEMAAKSIAETFPPIVTGARVAEQYVVAFFNNSVATGYGAVAKMGEVVGQWGNLMAKASSNLGTAVQGMVKVAEAGLAYFENAKQQAKAMAEGTGAVIGDALAGGLDLSNFEAKFQASLRKSIEGTLTSLIVQKVVMARMQPLLEQFTTALGLMNLEPGMNYAKTMIPQIAAMASSTAAAAAPLIKELQGALGSAFGGIPAMADGGIVTKPTLALIGEGGEPEVVSPLSKLGRLTGGGGGSTTNQIHVTINATGDGEEMGRQLVTYLRSQGVQFA